MWIDEFAQMITNFISDINIVDVIDIMVVALVVYKILEFISETRAEQLVKGIIILVIATFLSGQLHLYTLNWMLKGTMTLGLVALVIVFQPELRRALEYMGRSKLLRKSYADLNVEQAKLMAAEFAAAAEELSSSKTGALIVFERETPLTDLIETGTILKARVSDELIRNIFYSGSPLHDGAIIVRGDRIYAAGCVLPLTQTQSLSSSLGTRHRAAIGVTEVSDAVVLVISEENGVISMARGGKLERFLDARTVEKDILNLSLSDKETDSRRFKGIWGKVKNVQK